MKAAVSKGDEVGLNVLAGAQRLALSAASAGVTTSSAVELQTHEYLRSLGGSPDRHIIVPGYQRLRSGGHEG